MLNQSKKSRALYFLFKRFLVVSFCLCIISILISCSDDKIVNHTIDTDTINRYTWSVDTITGFQVEHIYVPDSENIYFGCELSLLHSYKGSLTSINLGDPEFYVDAVSGWDNNNIIVGGGHSFTYLGQPILKTITNGILQTYVLTSDSGGSAAGLFVEGPSSVWISTVNRWTVYHFNQGQFTPYPLLPGALLAGFYKDTLGFLYAFTNLLVDSTKIAKLCFKFTNERFMLINSDTMYRGSTLTEGMQRVGKLLIRTGLTSFYVFDNGNWQPVCPIIGYNPYIIAGSGLNDLLCWTGVNQQWAQFSWNGRKWFQERTGFNITNTRIEPRSSYYLGKTVYYSLLDYFDFHSYILKGVRKN